MGDASSYWEKARQRRLSRRLLLRSTTLAGAGAGAIALAGCGDDDGDSSQGTGTTSTAAGAAVRPKRGGRIVVGNFTGEQGHQDPHLEAAGLGHSRGTGVAYNMVIRKKLNAEVSKEESIEVIPDGDLAASWEQPDEKTFIFKLRPGVKWHNIPPVNGRALTAEDVVYSTRRQLDLKITASFLPGVERVSAPDRSSVRIELTRPDPDFLIAFMTAHNKIVAREAVSRGVTLGAAQPYVNNLFGPATPLDGPQQWELLWLDQ